MKNFILILLFVVSTSTNVFAQLTLPYTFENNSEYEDSEIYIGLVGKINPTGDVWMNMSDSSMQVMSADDNTVAGPEWSTPSTWLYPDIFTKLSDITNNTIQIPQGLFACRIFISFESPMYLHFHETGGYAGANLNSDSDPNDGIRWEIVELTWGDSGLWTNTSRVDAYQYPMGLEVNGFTGGVTGANYTEYYNDAVNGSGTPQFKKIGELLSHYDILAKWNEKVSEPYWVAKTIKTHSLDGNPIIEQPSKVSEFPKDILDTYIDDIWETYSNNDLNINIGDRGHWVGRVNSQDQFIFTDAGNGAVGIIYSKPTSVNAIEGSGSLAYTPNDAANPDEIQQYHDDLMIQAQVAAAISRHAIYTNIIDNTIQLTHDDSRFFQIAPYNEYVSFFHNDEISFESQTYAFAYDDVGDHSSTIQSTFPTDVKVIIGGYGENIVEESVLSSLKISTNNESFTTEDSIQFIAQGYNQNGKEITTDVVWSISSGEATINENGFFNTTIAGNYIIRATQGDIYVDEVVTITQALSTENCSGAPSNGDFSYSVSNEANNPSITFIPENENGSTTCILYYGTDANNTFGANTVIPNEPFQINANSGETIYFYYTYSETDGSENNTANDLQSFQVGNCGATLGLFDFDNSSDFGNLFTLFPNPTYGKDTYVSGLDEDVTIDVYTLNGTLLTSDVTTNVETVKVKTSNLSSGLYLVSVNTRDGQFSKTFKLIVN